MENSINVFFNIEETEEIIPSVKLEWGRYRVILRTNRNLLEMTFPKKDINLFIHGMEGIVSELKSLSQNGGLKYVAE